MFFPFSFQNCFQVIKILSPLFIYLHNSTEKLSLFLKSYLEFSLNALSDPAFQSLGSLWEVLYIYFTVFDIRDQQIYVNTRQIQMKMGCLILHLPLFFFMNIFVALKIFMGFFCLKFIKAYIKQFKENVEGKEDTMCLSLIPYIFSIFNFSICALK